ncbi:SDR family oxidoreductase [Streptomyces sp. TRM70308]|uniref:SDR family oxidoreductase n=1 Tax=Streptomyces sp. TRM70308 TaxID=3131932 RepID=UPI003CFD3C2D
MHVALTGATGFLGLRLLRRLLDAHDSVTVLAHAASGDALHRITRFFELSGAPEAVTARLPSRLRVVETQLERSRLGLSRSSFQELADGLDAIWHCAGSINLEGGLAELRRVNVDGTRHVLELAEAGRRGPALHHVSTAFVAGARRDGVAYEDELEDAYGFENAYERSKYEAEVLVHAWSRAHGRPAVVLRPSILVTDLPPHPELPPHPLEVIKRLLRAGVRALAPAASGRRTVRLVGRPHGHLNLMPVEDAAEVMVRLSGRRAPGGVDTYHVVHGHDVPVPVVVALLERLVPLSFELVASRCGAACELEELTDSYPGFTAYLAHRRRFDDTRVRTLLGPPTGRTRVDLDYLWSGLGPGSGDRREPATAAWTAPPAPPAPARPSPTPRYA